MQLKTILSVVVALVVVGGGVWYASTHQTGSTESSVTGTQAPEEQAEGTGTLADLMKRTGSYKCTVSMSGTNASSGTVYIGNSKLRGDFTTKVSGSSVESHMISTDGYVYTWSSLMPQGMKIKVDTSGSAASTQGGMNASAAVDYHCSPWSVDATQFTVPSSISFMLVGGN